MRSARLASDGQRGAVKVGEVGMVALRHRRAVVVMDGPRGAVTVVDLSSLQVSSTSAEAAGRSLLSPLSAE
jgi:hypothetical protein